MASPDTSTTMPHSNTDMIPNTHSEAGDRGSIISSRMTDIASDDGREHPADPAGRSVAQTYGDNVSRPTTGITRSSSQRAAWSQATPSRRAHGSGLVGQRGSIQGSISSSVGRPQSSSRTHVPSLTSHAFFHPMSSQRLQAQRGGSRPPTLIQQGKSEDGSTEGGTSLARQSMKSNETTKLGPSPHDGEVIPPPSRGTEMTEQETTERVTANTSPTHGHNGAGSLSESVRPLQRNLVSTRGLSLNIDKSYKNGGATTAPSKSPHSFRSSFLLPSRGDLPPSSPNRSSNGREKLPSIASSPGLTPIDAPKPVPKPKLGSNYQYFTGNTVFCWGGRLQNTRHSPINIATGLFVLIPGVLFFVFSAPWLWHNISPAIPIAFAYVFYICVSSFFHASVSDPGVS